VAQSDYTQVTISKATKRRLEALIAAIVEDTEAGKDRGVEVAAETINPQCKGLSIDGVIRLLLDRDESHREAARRQRQLARERRHKQRLDGIEPDADA